MPDTFHRHRALIHGAGLLLIEGPLQNQEGVIHVRARRFERLDGEHLRAKFPASHDFR